jgi:hypothetical protein
MRRRLRVLSVVLVLGGCATSAADSPLRGQVVLRDKSGQQVGGSGSFDATTQAVTLRSGPTGSLFGEGGTSLVIHAQQDDEKTDPTGNSGARIACGVITRS